MEERSQRHSANPHQHAVRNPPFRLQLVLPANGNAGGLFESRSGVATFWSPTPSVTSPPPPPPIASRPPYAQLLQLRRLHATTESIGDGGTRPGSSDSGISDCQPSLQQQQPPTHVVCRICLTSLASVGQSAAANCGHVACLPCLLTWYRTQSVCFCCRTATTGFTLLYL